MRKLFITICELEEIAYLPNGVETELFYAPIYEHAYRKIKDASNKLGLEVEFVRAATFKVRGATNEFNPGFDDIVAVVSPLVFLARSRWIEEALGFVVENDTAYATVGSIRGLYGAFGLGKMVSGAAIGTCYDFVHHMSECGAVYKNISIADGEKSVPSTRLEYYKKTELYRDEFLDYLIMSGVDIQSRAGVVIAPNTEIRRGTIIYTGTQIGQWTRIYESCEIGPNAVISEAEIGANDVIKSSYVIDSTLGENVSVGPYSSITSSHIFASTKVGGYVELENTNLGAYSNVLHQAVIMDSDIGARVEIGAGTATVNHSGRERKRCKIGDNVVIGCGVNLVAPLVVGAGAYVAAGSTITDDVPAGALAIAREYQTNREGWAKKRKKK